MTTRLSYSESDWLKRTIQCGFFVLAMILIFCFTAVPQGALGAGDNGYLLEGSAPAPRKALVIIASYYANIERVPSAAQDGSGLFDKLTGLEFNSITLSFNEPARQVWGKIREFQKSLEEGDLALVYFSGHGFQWKGMNFFAPVDVPASLSESTSDLTEAVVPISAVIQRLSDMKVGLGFIILDACRDNTLIVKSPEGISKSVGNSGLSQAEKRQVEVLIAYAANFGQISWGSDNPSENSLYTKHLLRNIDAEGLNIIEILQNVHADLQSECGCDQDPRVDIGSGTFHPKHNEDSKRLVTKTWVEARRSENTVFIQRFLHHYPVSEYSQLARQWLATNKDKVPSSRTFSIKRNYTNLYLFRIPGGYSVIRGENFAAPVVATTDDPSRGQTAIVVVENMKVFSRPAETSDQITTLKTGDTVWILKPDYSEEKSDKGTSVWSKILVGTDKDKQLVGYVKDAIGIDEDLQYSDEFLIKLKPIDRADLLEGKVLVSAVDKRDVSPPVSLIDAIKRNSGLLNPSTLSQSSILVKLHDYIGGTQSVEAARQLALLREIQIRDALVGSGAKKEKIFIQEPEVFQLGDKGKQGYDEIHVFLAK
jgi:hypothetical protein